MTSEVLAIIPARGGSKGIPRKNIAPLGGLPLVAYSIRAALACPTISRVVVSTDDEEIADVARAHGAEVPFLRPTGLAGDHSDIGQSIDHALKELTSRGYCLDHVVQLYPTSPFRTPALLERLVAPLLAGYQSSVVVRRFPVCGNYYAPQAGGGWSRLEFCAPGGAHFLRRYGVFLGQSVRPALRGTALYELDDPIVAIDLDTPEDLELAQAVIDNNLFDFGLA